MFMHHHHHSNITKAPADKSTQYTLKTMNKPIAVYPAITMGGRSLKIGYPIPFTLLEEGVANL